MMKRIVLLGLYIGIGMFGIAQNSQDKDFFKSLQEDSVAGSLVIVQDYELEELVNTHLSVNNRNSGVDGFRIQLYLGSNNNAKQESKEVKTKFLSIMPEESIYVMYEAPFWRVQAGDFRSKNEALLMYSELKRTFPSCYPVPVTNVDYNKFK